MSKTYKEWLKYYENATKEQIIEDVEHDNLEIKRLKEDNKYLNKVNIELSTENKRLNNIINKVEEHFVFLKMNSTGGNKEFFEDILDFIKALKELKGSD